MTGAEPVRVDGTLSPDTAPARRRRIVILTEDSKPALGGIAEYLHQLALAASTTHDVLVVTSVPGAEALNPGLPFRYREVEWYRPAHRWLGDEFMPWRRVNTLLWHLRRRRRVRGILMAIHAEQPDSSYVLGRISAVTRPWSVACADVGLSFAAIAYGLELVESLSRASQRQRVQTVAQAAHWFVISHDTAQKLERFAVPNTRQTLLLPGVAVPSRLPSAEERRAVRDGLHLGARPFILTLCYLRWRKGADLGIEALAALAEEFPNHLYVVAGAGPERAALEALAVERRVGDRVVFAGAVDEATKAVLLAECEFFVLPTRATAHDVEGFGIVFLEAGWYGKAVIGGANGGVPEAVTDGVTGLLVDTRDPSQLRDAERQLLRDPERAAALGRQGQVRARSAFSWADRGQVFTTQLDRLAARSKVAGRPLARPTTPVVRVRQEVGSARNRLKFSADTVVDLVRRGRLFTYFTPVTPPADQAACAQAIVGWIRRAIAAGGGEGASASYHIVQGWAGGYPEITGYLITTLLHYARVWDDGELAVAAERAGNWLAETRLPGGAICQKQWFAGNDAPSVFNTAQVLEGWCALARAGSAGRPGGGGGEGGGALRHDWLGLARESGDWLLQVQDPSGIWVRHAFNGIPHTYYARVASPLIRLAELVNDDRYATAARRALDWVLTQQTPSGWFQAAGFTATEYPTTHTIGYVLEGLINGARLLGDSRYAEAADLAARALLRVHADRGMLPGRFAPEWRPRARWRCLTGDAQIAIVWCLLSRLTGNAAYRAAAVQMAETLRQTVRVVPSWPEISGGVQGSSPGWGDYDPFGYPTHAAKFTLDLFALLAA